MTKNNKVFINCILATYFVSKVINNVYMNLYADATNNELDIFMVDTFDISLFEIDKEKNLVNLTKIANHFGKRVNKWT